MLRKIAYFSVVFTLLYFSNCAAFSAMSSKIGGDALKGYKEDGQYFVADRNGKTEVSRKTYIWSTIHGWSIFILMPFQGFAFLMIGEEWGKDVN